MAGKLGALALVVLLMTGCVKIDHLEEAIQSIDVFGGIINGTPAKVEAASHRIVDHLRAAGADLLANDVQKVMSRSVAHVGISGAKGPIAMVDRRAQAYLVAVKIALEEALPKIRAAGSKEKMIELLQNLVVEMPKLDPFVERAEAATISYERMRAADGTVKSVKLTSEAKLQAFGDALMGFPHDDLQVAFVPDGGERRRVEGVDIWVEHSPFLAVLDIEKLNAVADEVLRGSNVPMQLQVTHKGQLLIGFAVIVTDIAEPAPPEPMTKTVKARLYAIGEGKDGTAKETMLVPEGYRLVEDSLVIEEWTKNLAQSRVAAQNNGEWTYSVDVAPDRRSVVAQCWAASRPPFGARRWIGIDVSFQVVRITE